MLQQIRRRAALRLNLLDKDHPLIGRAAPPQKAKTGRPPKNPDTEPRKTRLQRLAQMEEPCERPELIEPTYNDNPEAALEGKEKGKREFEDALLADPPGTIHIYSDGSATGPKTSWAFVAYKEGEQVHAEGGSLPKAEVYDAEIRGAAEGLSWAEGAKDRLAPGKIVLCIDNTSVIRGITGRTPIGSQSQFVKLKSTKRRLEPITVEARWCPGHVGIKGNEEADALAKASADLPHPQEDQATVSWTRRRNREKRVGDYVKWWEQRAPKTYQNLGLTVGKRIPELTMPRQTLHRLLAERTGHGDFAEYHRRFKHEGKELTCKCGAEKAQWHFIDCDSTARWTYPEITTSAEKVRNLLGHKGWFLFQSLVETTGVYRGG